MTNHLMPEPTGLTIAAVERDTGLSKDILRAWERRYGFPAPARDLAGERVYDEHQLEKLRLLKRLVDRGERPGRLVGLAVAELQARLDAQGADVAAVGAGPATEGFIELLKAHDLAGLKRQLRQRRERLGPARFVTELVAPLNTQVGEAWMRGQLQVFEEHLYTEAIQGLLREAIGAVPAGRADDRPRVLLTTFRDEPHGLGLLMAELLFALDGAHCVSLGVGTPLWDIVLAATAQRCDVVALSFSGCMSPGQVVDSLGELRAKLPARIELWAGGAAPVLHRRALAGVTPIASLTQIRAELRRWRDFAAKP